MKRHKKDESTYAPFGLNIGHETIMTQSMYGIIYFMPADDEIIMPHLVCKRYYEPKISSIVLHTLDKDSIFVDIGANFGYFTALASSVIGPRGAGRVVAVEPNPQLTPYVKKNVSVNWSISPVTIHQAAVSDSVGEISLFRTRRSHGNSFIAGGDKEQILARWGDEINDAVTVPMTTGDEILAELPYVSLMKVDVEGNEPAVFRGLERTLAANPDCLFIAEWSPKAMRRSGHNPNALIENWKRHDLQVFDIETWRFIAYEALGQYSFTNLLLGSNEARLREIEQHARI